ncbi:MAG: hypothetical protein CM1200mP2_50470 [Planctomycetaceae bacterium]|nr:MAG: hypothetical protein CM1200mP2_50470 [Planctomycetaceae bacterium]
MFRVSAISMAIECSAVLVVLPAGVFITTTPDRVAASRSMLSTPTPALTITCSRRWPSRAFGFQLGAAANDHPVGCRQGVSQVVAVQPVPQVEVEMVMTTEYVKTGLGQWIGDQNAEHGDSSARTPDTWSVQRRPNEPLE